jgi:hypothetical protein
MGITVRLGGFLFAGVLLAALPAGAETLEVQNTSESTVCYVYVSPCDMNVWGPDILGSNTLTPGTAASVNINAGCWDLKAEDCQNATLATRRLTVTGDATWTLGGAASVPPPPPPPDPAVPRAQLERDTHRLTVKNRSGMQVCYVYVSPCSSGEWGADILEESVLNDGENARITVSEGCWDVKAEDCSNAVVGLRTGMQVSGSTNWTIAEPAPTTARIQLKNRTGETICYAYASPCASDNWGSDILDQSVLATGENANVIVPMGCWDLRVEDCDRGEIATRRGMEVTRNTSWTVQ